MTRGRLWVFNPGHEEALRHAEQACYTPSKTVRRMMHELAPLMCILASEGDYIYQPDKEGKTAVLLNHRGQVVLKDKTPTHLQLSPWAVERHIIKQVATWASSFGLELHQPCISPAYTALSHRRSSRDLLQYLLEQAPDLVPSPDILPVWLGIRSDDIPQITQHFQDLGYKHLVLKRPYSSSGRGVEAVDLPLSSERCDAIIKQIHAYECISLEPLLERVEDYALLFEAGADGVSFLGYSKFQNETERGFSYSGNILMPDAEIGAELAKILGSRNALENLKAQIINFLTDKLQGSYTGYIGIDMMSYLDPSGQLCLHPAVEINVRCTMGVIAHRLAQDLKPNEEAYYRLGYCSKGEVDRLRHKGDKINLLTPLPEVSAGFVAYIQYL